MLYRFEATTDFMSKLSEVTTLINLSESNDENSQLFLKLAAVSLVTKLQVYVENVLAEFFDYLKSNNIKCGQLSSHIRMNSLYLSFGNSQFITNLLRGRQYSEDKQEKIKIFVKGLHNIIDDEEVIDKDSFCFNVKFPLGKTGSGELKDLLKQIKGDDDPFDDTVNIQMLDSILQIRHTAVHHDRFGGTSVTACQHVEFCKQLAKYIDEYLKCNCPQCT